MWLIGQFKLYGRQEPRALPHLLCSVLFSHAVVWGRGAAIFGHYKVSIQRPCEVGWNSTGNMCACIWSLRMAVDNLQGREPQLSQLGWYWCSDAHGRYWHTLFIDSQQNLLFPYSIYTTVGACVPLIHASGYTTIIIVYQKSFKDLEVLCEVFTSLNAMLHVQYMYKQHQTHAHAHVVI